MSIEKSTSPEQWDTTGRKQADSLAVRDAQDSVEQSHNLQKINDALDALDLSDDQEAKYRSLLLAQGEQFLAEVLDAPKEQRLKLLAQAQFDALKAKGLTNLSKDERLTFLALKKQLVASGKSEIQQNDTVLADAKSKTEQEAVVIDAEESKQEQMRLAQAQKIAVLKTALLENPVIRDRATFENLFTELDGVDSHDETWKRTIIQRIINKLKTPWTLMAIAQDLGWPETPAYREFKTQLLTIEPSLQANFDRVEMDMAVSLAKLKLWTTTLDGVDLNDDTLIKTDGDVVIAAWKTTRNLSLTWSSYQLSSPLDPVHERQFQQVDKEATTALAPLNEQLGKLAAVMNYLQQAQASGQDLASGKAQIKTQHPELYHELWLETKTSWDDMLLACRQQQAEIDKSKQAIKKAAKVRLAKLVAANAVEAEEKDQLIENMLRFLHSVGFDAIDQSKLDTIIARVNISPHSYGLQHPIDFEHGSLGFDHDFWDKAISTPEKQAFIQFFNKMLWEPLVAEGIAWGATALSWQAQMRLQALSNKPVWFFMDNLSSKRNSE